RCGLPWPQWSGREKPWQRHAEGSRQRDSRRGAHGPARHHPEKRRRPRYFPCSRLRQRGCAMTVRSVVLGVGSALPARKVTNDELAEMGDTPDAWIADGHALKNQL